MPSQWDGGQIDIQPESPQSLELRDWVVVSETGILAVSELAEAHPERAPQSADAFLSRLPSKVISKRGQIIDIRGGLAESLSVEAGGQKVAVVETEIVAGMQARLSGGGEADGGLGGGRARDG